MILSTLAAITLAAAPGPAIQTPVASASSKQNSNNNGNLREKLRKAKEAGVVGDGRVIARIQKKRNGS
jgi:hypothetical protein